MASKSILIVGGCGQLGRACVEHFKKLRWTTFIVDQVLNSEISNELDTDADGSFAIDTKGSWADKSSNLLNTMKLARKEYDVVMSVAGGWAGDDISSADLIPSFESMWEMNVQSAVMAAQIAENNLAEGGLLVLTGAEAALRPTPGMLSYGTCKAATHHLVKTLGTSGGSFDSDYNGFSGKTCVAILPATIDTDTNRENMPDADFTSWTNPEEIASQVCKWVDEPNSCPKSGSLISCITKNDKTNFEVL